MIIGLAENDVRELVQTVLPADHPGDAWPEAFARAAWSAIIEPGDGVAGLLVTRLGPVAALEAVVAQTPVAGLLRKLGETGAISADLGAEQLEAALARWRPRLSSAEAVAGLRRAAAVGARLLTPDSERWPLGLDDLGAHAPMALWYRGRDQALTGIDDAIALVGARAATGYGEHVAMEASAGLVDRGHAIVSGAAYGIDGMAHRAALAGRGNTLAFLAGGVDRFYPSGHDALLTRISREGAVLAELPCGAAPSKWRFLQRNRLIAAVSAATVVLEAGTRSGSLNTAGHAAALGRPVGAVPGPVTSAASAGCHRLLREFDAVCVTNAAEMSELVRPVGAQPELVGYRDADQTRVLDALGRTPITIAEVARRSGLAPGAVTAALGVLEIEGLAETTATGWRRAARAR
ncbi:MAG: DNA-processing protein DprA [Microbacteriaceae bacterium]